MQKSIQKLACLIYGVMALYWCWILSYSEILKLQYRSLGILDLLALLAILALPAAAVTLIIIAFSKKEREKTVKTAVFLMALNIVLVELSVSAAWEVLYVNAHQMGQNFFIGTPISIIFDVFGSTTAIVVVTAFNIFSLKHPQESTIFNKKGMNEHICLTKSPYLKAKKFVAVVYSLLALLWGILLISTAFVDPPRAFETSDTAISVLSAALFFASGIFVFTKSFSEKASGIQILITGVLPVISLLPMLLIRKNDFDLFYEGAVEALFGRFSNNVFVVALSDVGFLNIVVGLIMVFVKFSMLKEKEE